MQGSGKNSSNKPKRPNQASILESLSEISRDTAKSFGRDLFSPLPQEALKQILRQPRAFPTPRRNLSAEMMPGESLEIKEVLSGTYEENKKLKAQVSLERRLREEEKQLVETRGRELKMMVHKLSQEVIKLSKSTQGLSKEIQKAAMYAPANPGIYHVVFFEKLISFLKSFTKKINQANLWLQSSNRRAEKKNYWAMYNKHGGKFLLSGEHYLQRSAG